MSLIKWREGLVSRDAFERRLARLEDTFEARLAKLENAHAPEHRRPVHGCPGCDAAAAEKMHEPVTGSLEL
jgi:hypothetical protein